MSKKQNDPISKYLLDNPIDRSEKTPYTEAAKRLGVTEEAIRSAWRRLRDKGLVEKGEAKLFIQYNKATPSYSEDKFSQKGDEAEVVKTTCKRVKTLEDLIEVCEIDLDTWEIVSWECNKWEVGAKDANDKVQVTPLFQVKAKLRIRKVDKDLGLQKELILKELKEYSPVVSEWYIDDREDLGECLLEIGAPDVHLGSLSWGEETGDNYDLKIAEERFKEAIENIVSRVNLEEVGRILFPLGNDFLNVDSKNNTTTNGTVVDTDVRFIKMLKAAKRIAIETIDRLSAIAPVDVVIVPGNHDFTSIFTIGEILDAFYHNNEKVTIFNSPKTRKYYKFGKVGIMLTHGDEEKHADLGLIFAAEEPKLWAKTEFRFIHLGHFHKNKKTSYLSTDEFQGVQLQILPTLSSATAWAYKKGYMSQKQAKGFLYHPSQGQIAEFTHTAKI